MGTELEFGGVSISFGDVWVRISFGGAEMGHHLAKLSEDLVW